MDVLVSSTVLVTLSEMGDKTQLLAFALAARYRRPWTVMLGILIATVLNHALAAWVGVAAASWLSPQVMAWVLAVSFLGFAVWMLKPDEMDDDDVSGRWGPLMTTIVVFFLAEMGDKTQLATVALGAKYAQAFLVIAGTTLGMLIADGLAVILGETLKDKIPFALLRYASAALFGLMGLASLAGAFGWWPLAS